MHMIASVSCSLILPALYMCNVLVVHFKEKKESFLKLRQRPEFFAERRWSLEPKTPKNQQKRPQHRRPISFPGCQRDHFGFSYAGNLSVTASGRKCLPWADAIDVEFHSLWIKKTFAFTRSNFSAGGVKDKNEGGKTLVSFSWNKERSTSLKQFSDFAVNLIIKAI